MEFLENFQKNFDENQKQKKKIRNKKLNHITKKYIPAQILINNHTIFINNKKYLNFTHSFMIDIYKNNLFATTYHGAVIDANILEFHKEHRNGIHIKTIKAGEVLNDKFDLYFNFVCVDGKHDELEIVVGNLNCKMNRDSLIPTCTTPYHPISFTKDIIVSCMYLSSELKTLLICIPITSGPYVFESGMLGFP